MINTQKEKYHLHFRADFSLFFYSFLTTNTDYLNIDYIYFYDPNLNCFSGYLSNKGLKQVANLGKKEILRNPKWKNTFIKGKRQFKYVDKLKDSKIPSINSPHFNKWWCQITKCAQIICFTYFYCEKPTLFFLEKIKDQKEIYKNLYYIGRYKLEAHKNLSVLESVFNKMIIKINKEYKIKIQDLKMLTFDEFNELIIGQFSKINISQIQRRKNGYVYRKKNKKWIVETGTIYKKWKNKLLSDKIQRQVSGTVAYKIDNKVRGRVRIHLSFSNIIKLSKNEILVTGMTNPQIVPMLKNVRAIVTDEGGLMCHAAIISREFKIPCIVGTGHATQIFKDGDLVEVDATKGVVKILKRNI